MNTDWLRSFVEVARQHSYSRAAARLYLSQPTVYHHVKLLEANLSARLVEQQGKRTELTAQGMLLFDRAARILEDIAGLKGMVQDDASLAGGRLSIGASTTFGQYLLPWLMTAFHQQHPGIRLDGHIINDTDIIDAMLLDRRLDAAISPGGRQCGGLLKLAIMKDSPVLVVPPDHSLAGLDGVTARELAGQPFVVLPRQSSFHQGLEAWFAEAGAALTVAMTLGSQESIKIAVLAGAGLAVLSYCTVAEEVATGRLVAAPILPRLERPWYLVLKSPVTTTHRVEAFLKLLHSDTWLPAGIRDRYTAHPDFLPPPVHRNGNVTIERAYA